jgi:thiopeptide-type bacteriocin biosynthesis protein
MRPDASLATSAADTAPGFRCAGVALLRAPLLPLHWAARAAVAVREATPAELRSYVASLTCRPEVREALLVSSESLSSTLDALDAADRQVDRQAERRAAYAVSRYWLRMTTRATPFGLTAGVTSAAFGDTAEAVLGAGHTKAAHPDMSWLLALVERWQQDPRVLHRLRVVANDLATVRDGRLVLEHVTHAAHDEAPAPVSLRHTPAVRAVLALSAHPVPFTDLVGALGRSFPSAPQEAVHGLVRDLVKHQILLTDLVPSPAVPDPLAHVLAVLEPLLDLPEFAELRIVQTELAQYSRSPLGEGQRLWRSVTARMRRLQPARDVVATDLRLDAGVTLPREVAEEAERAAEVLLRIAPPVSVHHHLVDYHREFVERYGTEQAVPLRTLLDPGTGLGAPAGYARPHSERMESPRPVPGDTSDRERLLGSLVQAASLERSREVVLTDELTELLDNGLRAHDAFMFCDLFTTLLARSCEELDAGDFRLLLHPRHGATWAGAFGRFARLTGATDELTSFVRQFRPPSGALPVQVSWRPGETHSGNVARAPWLRDHRLPVGWFDERGSDGVLGLDDLVITASTEWFHVFSRSSGTELAPNYGHMLNYETAPNTVRFLIDVTVSRPQPAHRWDWGNVEALPFLPRVRYGRTVLTQARWLPDRTLYAGAGLPTGEWADRFSAWRRRWLVPRYVEMAFMDLRVRIDLDEPHHLDLLRQQLRKAPWTVLTEVPDIESYGWLNGPEGVHANEIVFPLAARRDPTALQISAHGRTPGRPRARPEEHRIGHLPGGEWLYAKLYCPPGLQDRVLAGHLPQLVAAVDAAVDRWFFVRYRDDAGHHLRLRFHGDPAVLGSRALPALHHWAEGLRRAGLAGALVLDTYDPELERYGGPAAIMMAEQVFHADSVAVLAQLTGDASRRSEPPELLAAVNFVDIVRAFHLWDGAGDDWLLACFPKVEEHHRAFQKHRSACLTLIGSGDEPVPPAELALDDDATAAWQTRSAVVARYGELLHGLDDDEAWGTPSQALASLVHMHHNRLLGIDPGSEKRARAMARGALQVHHDRTHAMARSTLLGRV